MSEELIQKGYVDKKGKARGDAVGPYEGFNIGATTLDQLRQYKIVPDRAYGKQGKNKPDGIVVDRRGSTPIVKFIAEFKNVGLLKTSALTDIVSAKLAEEYCRPLSCEFGGISDRAHNTWLLVTPNTWNAILREDDYPLDYPIDFGRPEGRDLLGRTLIRLETTLNKPRHALQAVDAVNPTRLAEQTWQDIWLACGEQPEACLATFIEILIFKFLSDQGVLKTTPAGVPVDFATVLSKSNHEVLKYYFNIVRPDIRRIFPPGLDGTSIINGMVFNPDAADQGRLFHQILERFDEFGSLKRIDPEFKSRIFERFLKKSLSVKNWGQYFTPRNVVKAMVEMSGVESLSPGSVVADPACGVGGFLLEPLMNKRPSDFRTSASPHLRYIGLDRDDKTIILAKANMLVHLSEAMEQDAANAVKYLAPILNETFNSTSKELTGSLAKTPVDEYDLVITNPPYVTRGTGKQRDFLREHADYYGIPGSGIENLFVQLIINGLKPGCRALVVVPDGLLLRHSEEALKKHMLHTCTLEAVVSLPVGTFYSTPKKTYILVIRKKLKVGIVQTSPVFSYLVSDVGETMDAKRFVIAENDLPNMASWFKSFQGNPAAFETTDPKCKTFPFAKFHPSEHWLVNKWWSMAEREQFGDVEAESFVGASELSGILQGASSTLGSFAKDLGAAKPVTFVKRTATISLSDARFFRMGIGERVLKRDLFGIEKGKIPLYSANVEIGSEHGWINESNLADFMRPSLLWSIDSDFNISVRDAGFVFATTDHCGRLEILTSDLDPYYCQAAILYGYGRIFGFDRVTRPSLKRMRQVFLRIPIKADGAFDMAAQQELANEFTNVKEAIRAVADSLDAIVRLRPKVEIPKETEDLEFNAIVGDPNRLINKEEAEDADDLETAVRRIRDLAYGKSKKVKGKILRDRLALLEAE